VPEMEHTLARLIDEITVDAYDTTEQLSAFLQVLRRDRHPASAVVLGMDVEVTASTLEGDERRGCRPLPYRGPRARSRSPTSTSSRTQLPDGSTPPTGLALSPPFPGRRPQGWACPRSSEPGLVAAGHSGPRPAHDRRAGGLLNELLASHPELTAEAERLALADLPQLTPTRWPSHRMETSGRRRRPARLPRGRVRGRGTWR